MERSIKRYFVGLLLSGLAIPGHAQVVSNTGAVLHVSTSSAWSGGSLQASAGNIVNNGNMSLGSVTLSSGVTLTNNNSVRISGHVTGNGGFVSSAGSLELNGNSAQSIASGSFSSNTIRDLTISNSSGVTLNGSLNISDFLKANSGNFVTGNNLTLFSTATKTAYVDGSGGGNITGTLTMQRYLPSELGYRYISSPFQSATVSELSDNLSLSDSFARLYRYDENVSHAGWVRYTTANNVLSPLRGYAANFGASSSAKTIDIKGVVNNGSLNINLVFNNQTYTKGFNLVGNPYPSPIDWNAANGWTKTNVDNAIYYFNNGTSDRYSGSYSSYINGVSSDGIASNIIPSMQGFFVHVSNGSFPVSATLGINNNARVNSLNPYYHKQAGGGAEGLVRISAGYEQADSLADPMVVYFSTDAMEQFEQDMDALKLLNTDVRVPSLYSMAGEAPVAINGLPMPGLTTPAIPLGLETQQKGTVRIQVQDIEQLAAGLHVYLADAVTGIIQDLEQRPLYRLELDKGSYRNRFYLLFSRQEEVQLPGAAPLLVFVKDGHLMVQLTEAQGELQVHTAQGQILVQQELRHSGLHEIPLQDWAAGVYLVSLSSPSGKRSGKVVVGQ